MLYEYTTSIKFHENVGTLLVFGGVDQRVSRRDKIPRRDKKHLPIYELLKFQSQILSFLIFENSHLI